MDGLPALHAAQKTMMQEKIEPLKKMVGPLAPSCYQNSNRYGLEHLLLVALVTGMVTAVIMSYGLDTARIVAVRAGNETSRLMHAPLGTLL